MPKIDGAGVIDGIRQKDASARIIVLTTYDSENEIYRAIKAGAKGYLLKDARREELLDCIRKVSRGETCIPQALAERLAAGVSGETLTGRELGVLTLLARGKSNKEIGANLFISESTVKGHLRNIFTKLNVLSRTASVAITYSKGADAAASVVKAIESAGGKAIAIQAEATDAGAVKAAIEKAVASFGRLDVS